MDIVFDIECYPNYFLIMFMNIRDERIKYFEMHNNKWNQEGLREFIHKPRRTFIGFNSLNYDLPVLAAALKRNATNQSVKAVSDAIIVDRVRHWQMDLKLPPIDHIDLMPVAPSTEDDSAKGAARVGLKLYGARMHSKKLQDLPLPPDSHIGDHEASELRKYCVNDLQLTMELHEAIKPLINLRENWGKDYRSKSNPQMAESMFREKLNSAGIVTEKQPKPKIIKYTPPEWIHFEEDEELKQILHDMKEAKFIVNQETGSPSAPSGNAWAWDIYNDPIELKKLEKGRDKSKAGKKRYDKWNNKMKELLKEKDMSSLSMLGIEGRVYNNRVGIGIGGLHSKEKAQSIVTSSEELLFDIDFASFYPHIIIREGFYPKHLTSGFLTMYENLMADRLKAKRSGDTVMNEGYKIAINGTYGKMGSQYSFLYDPAMMIHVTLTGQLILLMLVEKVELAGGRVVSVNTDGIVVWCHKSAYEAVKDAYLEIEMLSGIELEESRYKALYSESVNRYIAVKYDGTCKGKGLYGKPGLTKTPDYEICAMAVKDYITKGIPLYETIHNNRDIRNFVKVRKVKGTAMFKGKLIGKLIRFYHSGDEAIYDSMSGKIVATSDGCKPLMELPDEFPDDIDYAWYVRQAGKMLKGLGL